MENENKIYDIEVNPIELLEVLKKMEIKFQSQRNDINVISQSLKSLQINYKDFKRESNEVMRDQIKNIDNIFNEIYESVDEVENHQIKGERNEYNNVIKELLKSDFSAKIQQIQEQIQKNDFNTNLNANSKKSDNNLFIWLIFGISIANLLLSLKIIFLGGN
ncbi:hypothetical protein E3U40_10140 [Campylobacter fetus subsp. venerealis]|uniref:hypothetical protein n=1 Tax=Campylobacter fetus TaxID=196 RepID=UPI00122FC50D|nr:hypothetical protein [Campylobacter fetus]KAA3682596.1 hypothetical protein E3U40_10140 [Campylobacter fetus subsp. venerealis]